MQLPFTTVLALLPVLAIGFPQGPSQLSSTLRPRDDPIDLPFDMQCQTIKGGPGKNTLATLQRVFKEKFLANGDRPLKGQNQISGKRGDDHLCVTCSGGVLFFKNGGADTSNRVLRVKEFDEAVEDINADGTSCVVGIGFDDTWMLLQYGNIDDFHKGDADDCLPC